VCVTECDQVQHRQKRSDWER